MTDYHICRHDTLVIENSSICVNAKNNKVNCPVRRILAVVLVVVMLFGNSLASAASYVPKEKLSSSVGIEALRDEFESGTATEAFGYQLDYTYYSPVGTEDTTKYPLVIFLHGVNHGSYPGSQLDDSNMPYWATSELQSRFSDAGGAFILLPRSPEGQNVYWSNSLIEPLYMVIRDFIAANKDNIDTTRIYISGSSQGGAMCWKMIKAYPGMFAAAFPLAATQFDLDADDVKQCSQTSFWIIASSRDFIVNYQLCTMRVWNNICRYNDHPENCRLSTLTKVTNPDGEESADNHHLAEVITYDLFTHKNEPYPNMTTVDTKGNEIEVVSPDGLISWMSAIRSDYDGHDFEGSGTAEQSFKTVFLDKLLYKLFNLVVKIQDMAGL